jgi:acetyltransferase-like isoleucine patch superfamily enzyme
MAVLSRMYDGVKTLGPLGVLKSVYYSKKYTGDLNSLVFHSKVITEIAEETTFDINNQLVVGVKSGTATHPRMARSKFETRPGSSVTHTGEERAKIEPGCAVFINGDFSIGDSYINGFSRIACSNEITIGDNCAVSWECEIMDSNGHSIKYDGVTPESDSAVEIRNNVWIGHSAIINKGVTIHEGSVVASGSVVVSDVPPNTLVAGNPAEVVRENVSWEL